MDGGVRPGARGPGRFEIRRQSVAPRPPAVFDLPLPGDDETDGVWRETARCTLLNSRVRPFVGPVEVSLAFRAGRRTRMIGDLPNACLQLLIATRLIAGADSAVLKRLTLAWGGTQSLRVEIREFAAWPLPHFARRSPGSIRATCSSRV